MQPADSTLQKSAGRLSPARWVVEFLIVGAGLALFVGLLYYRLLFTNRVLASGDILHYFYPYRDYAAAALREGRIPLWNPYIFLGAPFLANPQAAALYPLHWPLIWLPVTKQIAWSAAIHTWLLGMGGYALMRQWRQTIWAGAASAIALAGSGFYGGLLGHINQMNGAAWLPWAVLALDMDDGESDHLAWRLRLLQPGMLVRVAVFGLLTALMFLSGHTQTVYINLLGLGVWSVWPLLWSLWGSRGLGGLRAGWAACVPRLIVYAAGGALGLLISGAQLLPTLELSALGLRSGGLDYAEASSFSLKPLHMLWTLLPSYGLADLGVVFDTLGYTEYVAYLGLLGLALAVVGAWRGRGTARQFGLLMAGLGLFLALGRWNPVYYVLFRIVPGFDLFRAPARWMMLYTLGMATLAGLGVDVILLAARRRWQARRKTQGAPVQKTPMYSVVAAVLVMALAIELLLAARSLPHTHPTAPQAVYDLRTAPAHLLTDPARAEVGPGAAGRFLSMSNIAFDPGDMADYRRIFLGDQTEDATAQLDEDAFADLIVAFKAQEILAPSLALLRRIPSVDGFDGGVLPLRRYLDLLELFIPADELVPDGRLREQVQRVPDAKLLGLLNVQYVITDKVRDLWFDDVYYDRQIGARLGQSGVDEIAVEVPYPFESTHVDIIGYVDGDNAGGNLPTENWIAASVSALTGDEIDREWAVFAGPEAGAHFADGALGSVLVDANGAEIAYRDVEGGKQEYRARLPLAEPSAPDRIMIRPVAGPDVVIQAVTLYDDRTGMFLSLTPSDRGRFRRVHSGDVKVYENLDVLPRAYLAHEVIPATDGEQALAEVKSMLQGGGYEPGRTVVVEGGTALDEALDVATYASDQVELKAYSDSQIEVRTSSLSDGFLALSDVIYPGWRASVDGEDAPVYAANHLFRGVYVPAGDHTVVFQFAPDSLRQGLLLTVLGIALAALLLGWALLRSVRLRD